MQLDQLDKIFKVLGNLFAYCFSFSLLGDFHSLDDIPDPHTWTFVTVPGHPTLEKWPSLAHLPHWNQDTSHIQGHK